MIKHYDIRDYSLRNSRDTRIKETKNKEESTMKNLTYLVMGVLASLMLVLSLLSCLNQKRIFY